MEVKVGDWVKVRNGTSKKSDYVHYAPDGYYQVTRVLNDSPYSISIRVSKDTYGYTQDIHSRDFTLANYIDSKLWKALYGDQR
jgi:hypothetical protein